MDNYIREQLFSLSDLSYKQFHAKLIPTVSEDRIIGVRIPDTRRLAKRLTSEKCYGDFLSDLPHYFYEENNLHAFIMSEIKDYNLLIDEIDRFLPFVDNWATCDSLRPRIFTNNKKLLITDIRRWMNQKDEFTVRFAIEALMVHFLDEDFDISLHNRVAEIKSDKYYVNMMIAWYFATALAKQWDNTVIFLEENKLDYFVHNKTIQKAVESLRIDKDKKDYLKTLKRS